MYAYQILQSRIYLFVPIHVHHHDWFWPLLLSISRGFSKQNPLKNRQSKGVKNINLLLKLKIFVNLKGVIINYLFASKYSSNEKVSRSIFRVNFKKVKISKTRNPFRIWIHIEMKLLTFKHFIFNNFLKVKFYVNIVLEIFQKSLIIQSEQNNNFLSMYSQSKCVQGDPTSM